MTPCNVVSVRERIDAIERECSGVWSTYGITSWERERLIEWKAKGVLSSRQLEILHAIEAKAFPEEADRGD